MRPNPTDDELLRSYLLGELPEEEADRLEQRLLAEDELFELSEAVEADLLAACARGELAPAERERVQQRLASSPRGRERLALAHALNTLAGSSGRAAAPVVLFPRRAATPRPRSAGPPWRRPSSPRPASPGSPWSGPTGARPRPGSPRSDQLRRTPEPRRRRVEHRRRSRSP